MKPLPLFSFGSCVGVIMSSKARRIIELETICGQLRDEVAELRNRLQTNELMSGIDKSYDSNLISCDDLRRKIDMSNSYWDW